MIHFTCAKCGRGLKIDNTRSEQPVRCPRCLAWNIVPKSLGQLVVSEPPPAQPVSVSAPPPVRNVAPALPKNIVEHSDGDGDGELIARKRSRLLLLASLGIVGVLIGSSVLVVFLLSRSKEALPQRLAAMQAPDKADDGPPPAVAPKQGIEPPHDKSQPARPKSVAPPPRAKPTPPAGQAPDDASPDAPEIMRGIGPGPEQNDGAPKRAQVHPSEPAPPADPRHLRIRPKDDDKMPDKVAELVRVLRKQDAGLKDRILAINRLKRMGMEADAASRDLCNALLDRNKEIQDAASDALDSVNHRIHEIAIPLWRDPSPEAARKAMQSIVDLGQAANPVVPILRYREHRWNRAQRQQNGALWVQAVASAAGGEKLTVNKFMRELLDSSHQGNNVRVAISKCLPHMEGAEVSERARALTAAAQDRTSAEVRAAAASALAELRFNSPKILRVLRHLKNDPNAAVREAAGRALDQLEQIR